MCGIAGIASEFPREGELRLAQRMCELLAHRGPDDSGLYQDRGVVLGHTRLSIIDVAGGHQPLSNEDDTVWVILNGEIYNYAELRADLLTRGHQFRTATDTEVLVHLYEEYGIEFIEKLNGMYAFALWDAKCRVLYLVRDRLGIKPLYYAAQNGRLLFASEMKALLADPRLSTTIDKEAIAQALVLLYIPEPKTPFSEIRKLRRGSFLKFHDGEISEKTYWRIPSGHSVEDRSVSSLCEELRWLMEDSTRLQLRADVPVGLFASGGIDSSAIMWAASRQNVSLDAFLVEFDHLAIDTPYARLASKATGMSLIEGHLSGDLAGCLLPKLIWHLDEPLADPAIVPCYFVAQHVGQRVKVILNGTGGDELYGGYPRYNLRGLLPSQWLQGIGTVWPSESGYWPWLDRIGGALDFRNRYFRRLSHFPEKALRRAMGLRGRDTVSAMVSNLFSESERSDPANAMMYVDLNLYLPGDLLMMLDKMTMAASLEARVPLLDHRIVEFAATLPGTLKMQGRELKWLLRHALRGLLPDTILDRPKQGFGPPVAEWMRGPLGDATHKLLSDPKSRLRNLLPKEWILSALAESPGDSGHPYRMWALLTLELWWRAFVDKADFAQVGVEELAEQTAA